MLGIYPEPGVFGVVGALASGAPLVRTVTWRPSGSPAQWPQPRVATVRHDRGCSGLADAAAAGAGDVVGEAVLGVADPEHPAVEVGEHVAGPTVVWRWRCPRVLGRLRLPASTRAWGGHEGPVQQHPATGAPPLEERLEVPNRRGPAPVTAAVTPTSAGNGTAR